MKKIAHIVRRFSLEDWGGIEEGVFHLSKKLMEKGIDCEIHCTDALSKPGVENIEGVPVHRYPSVIPTFGLSKEMKNRLERKGANSLSFPMLFSLLKERGLSLIHAHVQHRLGGVARTTARLKNIPYVVTLHGGEMTLTQEQVQMMRDGTEHLWEWGKVFGWLLGARRTIEDADAVVSVGRDEYALMKEKYPEKEVHYVPNGIEIGRFEQKDPSLFRREVGLDNDEPYILSVSRIDPQKNQRLLIEAFSRVDPKYRLVLIGPVTVPDYLTELKSVIKQQGLDERVIIIEGYSAGDPRLVSAYAGASLFVLPSTMEPFGIVVLEAWASKIPVVASHVGGIRGFTAHGKNVLHFQSGNGEELIDRLHQGLKDADLRNLMIKEGWKQVQQYTWDQVAETYLQIYDRAVCRCG